ncbi:MAG: sugar ABC transporter permease [Planctomycetota bacterium]|jgi:multiple sugar transport system permease protein|nr:sugar ABC transporter permease [Planctomycetota bacterium]
MRNTSLPYVFLIPALIVLGILALVPTLGAINLSLQDRSLMFKDWDYVWFQNYLDLIKDSRFFNALWVSVKWEVVTVVGTMFIAVVGGVILYEKTFGKWRKILSLLLFIPVLLPKISAGYIWKFMLNPLMGIVNIMITSLGLPHVEFLSSPTYAIYSVAMVDIWQWGTFFAVIVLNLIETLPQSNMDCAKMECNNVLEVYGLVAIPMLRGPLVAITFVKMIESLRSFDLIYTMTNGGPGISTETVDLFAFVTGISVGGEVSYASAISVMMMIITVVLFTLLWKRASR